MPNYAAKPDILCTQLYLCLLLALLTVMLLKPYQTDIKKSKMYFKENDYSIVFVSAVLFGKGRSCNKRKVAVHEH